MSMSTVVLPTADAKKDMLIEDRSRLLANESTDETTRINK